MWQGLVNWVYSWFLSDQDMFERRYTQTLQRQIEDRKAAERRHLLEIQREEQAKARIAEAELVRTKKKEAEKRLWQCFQVYKYRKMGYNWEYCSELTGVPLNECLLAYRIAKLKNAELMYG